MTQYARSQPGVASALPSLRVRCAADVSLGTIEVRQAPEPMLETQQFEPMLKTQQFGYCRSCMLLASLVCTTAHADQITQCTGMNL